MVIKIDRASTQRENILKNSFILFKENGYNNTTTREIAKSSGINKGLLHYYYKQKEEIITEMYFDIIKSLNEYVDNVYKGNVSGWVYYSSLNILFFRTMSSKPYLIDLLSEIMLNRNLTQMKIEKSVKTCYEIIENYKIPISEYHLFLAITVAAGAETELLFSIRNGKLKMTYDKLATTISKLLFTMLKISEKEIKKINDESIQNANRISTTSVFEYIKSNNSWLQD